MIKKAIVLLKRIPCLFFHVSDSYEFGSMLTCKRCGKTVSDTNFRVTTNMDIFNNKIYWYLN